MKQIYLIMNNYNKYETKAALLVQPLRFLLAHFSQEIAEHLVQSSDNAIGNPLERGKHIGQESVLLSHNHQNGDDDRQYNKKQTQSTANPPESRASIRNIGLTVCLSKGDSTAITMQPDGKTSNCHATELFGSIERFRTYQHRYQSDDKYVQADNDADVDVLQSFPYGVLLFVSRPDFGSVGEVTIETGDFVQNAAHSELLSWCVTPILFFPNTACQKNVTTSVTICVLSYFRGKVNIM